MPAPPLWSVLLAGLALWALAAGTPPGAEADRPDARFAFHITLEKPVYRTGEEGVVVLEAVNETPHRLTLQFPTAQRFDLVITDAQERERWRWSADRVFATVLGEETLGAAQPRLVYRTRVRFALPAGRYVLRGLVTDRDRAFSAQVPLVIE